MGTVNLEFPVFVQTSDGSGEKEYIVRPLFLAEPVARHRRFEKALRILLGSLRHRFMQFHSNRENIDTLLWLMFNPDLHFDQLKLEFRSGMRFVSGEFTLCWFELDGKRIVCLPTFENHFFVAPRERGGRGKLVEQVEGVLQRIFRKMRQKTGQEIDPTPFMATKGDFYTTASLTLAIKQGKMPFDRDFSGMFASIFGGQEDFDGAWEIQKVGYDMNFLYPDELMSAPYREDLTGSIHQMIYQKEKIPFVLVGPSRVGKTSLLHQALYRYLEEHREERTQDLEKIWHMDPTRVITGMSIVGMWQRRLESILKYIKKGRGKKSSNKRSLRGDKLYIDNLVALLRIGKSAQNDMTMSDVLKPYLENREIQLIGEATPEEWKTVQELDRSFADLFQVLRIPEASDVDSMKMVILQRSLLERENQCTISNRAFNRIYNLRSYLKNGVMPGKMVDFLKRLCGKYRGWMVEIPTVHREFQSLSQMNETFLDGNYCFKGGEVEGALKEHLVGQKEAIHCLANTIHTIKSGLNNPEKPYGAFLFIGPTGVGKTEAAKALARHLFESEENLIRFDMNEFIDSDGVLRLIGDLSNPEGQLTSKILYHPFCVLLFDEIEKAHPDVHDLLLQVLGEGRLTDALGRTVDFTRTVIIMTSNLGASDARKDMGFQKSQDRQPGIYRKAVEEFFRPELINRIDQIVVFHPLKEEEIMEIAQLQIERLLERDGFLRRTTLLNVSEKALRKVAQKGFDPLMGGRALKRSIEKELTAVVADVLVGLPNECPIIFEIFQSGERLLPRITALEEVPPLSEPLFPKTNFGKALPLAEFQDLLKQVKSLEGDLSKRRGKSRQGKKVVHPKEWEFYLFKDQIGEIREALQDVLWKLEGQAEFRQPVLPMKKQFRVSRTMKDLREGPSLKDILSNLAVRDYLSEVYQNSPYLFQEWEEVYFRHFLDLAYLYFFSKGLTLGVVEQVCFHIQSRVERQGKKEVAYLEESYQRLLEDMGFGVETFSKELFFSGDGTESYFAARGPRLFDLFTGEKGIHFFLRHHSPSLPVQVSLSKVPSSITPLDFLQGEGNRRKEWQEKLEKGRTHPGELVEENLKILRLYSLAEEGQGDTITDLRTRLIQRSRMEIFNWKIFLYGAFDQEDRMGEL